MVLSMKFILIPNWNKKDLRCHFCGTNKSVKYESNVDGEKVCVCNRCVLTENDFLEDLQMEQREQM